MKKDKNSQHTQKHLTLSDRTFIEQELQQGSTFSYIASILDKDSSTISKEVRLHRIMHEDNKYRSKCRGCMHYSDCSERHVCGLEKCNYACRYCYKKDPTPYCLLYKTWECIIPSKPPYVCNACTRFNTCKLLKYHYVAIKAQASYESTLTKSRTGINMTPEELQELNELISPLILKGQPLSIFLQYMQMKFLYVEERYTTTLINEFFKQEILIFLGVSATKRERKNLPHAQAKIYYRNIVTNVLILIFNDLWNHIQMLM